MNIFNLFGPPPEECYWILVIPTYGKFVYYGNEKDAQRLVDKYSIWNKVDGSKRKADKKDPTDYKMVEQEILGCIEDHRAGMPDIPYLPQEGWLK